MTRFIPTLTFALFMLGLVAAPAQAQHEIVHEKHHAQMTGEMAEVVQPELVGGVQVVEITVTPQGYSAERIALKAGVPARLVFTRTVDGGCVFQVQGPDFGIEATDLPLNEPVAVEFTPEEAGDYTFACGMGMLQGTILVKA